MQQLISTEEEDRSLQLPAGETIAQLSLAKKRVTQQLNQEELRMNAPPFCPLNTKGTSTGMSGQNIIDRDKVC